MFNYKNKFFKKVKVYNKKLITQSKDYKVIINSLVVKLKEEVILIKLK